MSNVQSVAFPSLASSRPDNKRVRPEADSAEGLGAAGAAHHPLVARSECSVSATQCRHILCQDGLAGLDSTRSGPGDVDEEGGAPSAMQRLSVKAAWNCCEGMNLCK